MRGICWGPAQHNRDKRTKPRPKLWEWDCQTSGNIPLHSFSPHKKKVCETPRINNAELQFWVGLPSPYHLQWSHFLWTVTQAPHPACGAWQLTLCWCVVGWPKAYLNVTVKLFSKCINIQICRLSGFFLYACECVCMWVCMCMWICVCVSSYVCVRESVCIWIYILEFVCVCLYVCGYVYESLYCVDMYVRVCMYVGMYVWVCMYVGMYVRVCMCVDMYVWVCMCMCECEFVCGCGCFVSEFVCVWVWMCVYMTLHVCVSVNLCVYICICMCAWVWICVCMWVCMCVSMQVCMCECSVYSFRVYKDEVRCTALYV